LFKLADRLHIRTKHATIQAQLLFASGDRYLARKLAETERVLRLLPYVYDARIVPVHTRRQSRYQGHYQRCWTLSPGISFSRSGGTNDSKFQPPRHQFPGWGKTLQISRGSTVDRTSNTIAWTDPNVLGSRWTSAATYSDSSDGSQRAVLLAHPFYSLDAPWSTKISAISFDRTISRYNLGNIVDQFSDNEHSYELSGGISSGLVDGWTKRWTFGMRYDRNCSCRRRSRQCPRRSCRPTERCHTLHRIRYPSGRYKKWRRKSDRPHRRLILRHEVTGEIGYSSSTFGADRDAVMLSAKALHGFELPRQQQLFFDQRFFLAYRAGTSAQFDCGRRRQYYWRWREDWLLSPRCREPRPISWIRKCSFCSARDMVFALPVALRVGHLPGAVRTGGSSEVLSRAEAAFPDPAYRSWFPTGAA